MEINKYVIAGLKVLLTCHGERTLNQSRAYLCDFEGDPDITINISKETVLDIMGKNPESKLGFSDWEYILTGSRFYYDFIRFNGFMLHSSCVVTDNKAYMFSAQSGTGKSTHTSLWCKYLGERAFILNDDKPAIRLEDGRFYAYGTPWSGKTDQNVNARYPVGAVAFIERSGHCFIEPMSSKDAVKNIYWQTIKPRIESNADALFDACGKFIENVPIYRFGADISEDAFVTSYEKMTGNKYRIKGEAYYMG